MKLTTVLGIVVVILAGYVIPGRIGVTLSASLNHRVYYVRHICCGEVPAKGDYIVTSIRSEYIHGGKRVRITKRVECAPGDRLEVRQRDYFCNGRSIGKAKQRSQHGRLVDNFIYDGVIPPGALFVMGDSKDSFDSRYFGFVETKNVTAIEYPIF